MDRKDRITKCGSEACDGGVGCFNATRPQKVNLCLQCLCSQCTRGRCEVVQQVRLRETSEVDKNGQTNERIAR